MSFDLDTIVGSRIRTSVSVNGFFVPANSLSDYLLRYCDPALFHNENEDLYRLTKSGSLFRVKFGQRYFALTTRHQLSTAGYNYDQLCIVAADDKTMFTSHSAVFPDGDDDHNDDYDVLLFEFTELVSSRELPKSVWCDLGNDMCRNGPREPGIVCCIGYPGYLNFIDYDEVVYSPAPSAVWGDEIQSVISGRLSFTPSPEISFDPAGMSGAPVFGLHINTKTISIFFAGILTNASAQRFNFISMTRLRKIIDRA